MLDLRSGGVKLRRRRVPGGLPFWKESPLMDPGRQAETTVTEAGESEGNPSCTEVKLQDDQLRLRGGQVRGRRRGIWVTCLAVGAVAARRGGQRGR